MSELKLLIEHTGHTYTLKPNREYAIGSASDCDIRLTDPQVSPWHLKFSFDQFSKTWHIYDLGSSTGTLIDNQPISDYPLVAQKRVSLGSGIHLIATPEGSKTTPASQPAPPTTPQPVPAPPPSHIPQGDLIAFTPVFPRRSTGYYTHFCRNTTPSAIAPSVRGVAMGTERWSGNSDLWISRVWIQPLAQCQSDPLPVHSFQFRQFFNGVTPRFRTACRTSQSVQNGCLSPI
ncbi:FHA domain-containing protein [Laspinema olomoucense]|uniref:FHA domain-containing protein n=1 Tax=Laspinema olomoucense TaxID=3231600 RepID=UPI0021BABDF6|nr:FHA domain-containing protein [Laspinema sp. D3c]MCT7996085.1 FHA domain-containing protein [Laspinema sp. D3c]